MQIKNPKVSIIMTTYNHEKYIGSAIESVLSQSYQNWELLIGDDCSSDGTHEILDQYVNNPRIKIIVNPQNIGITKNMNNLLYSVSSDSEYVMFLEGDDMYTKNYVAEFITLMSSAAVDIGISNYNIINGNGDKIHSSFLSKLFSCNISLLKDGINKISIADLLLFGNQVKTFGLLCIKKSALDHYLPLKMLGEGNFLLTDFLFYLEVLGNNEFIYIESNRMLYRSHGLNTSYNHIKITKQLELIYDTYYPQYPKECSFHKVYKSIFIKMKQGTYDPFIDYFYLLKTYPYLFYRSISSMFKILLLLLIPLRIRLIFFKIKN